MDAYCLISIDRRCSCALKISHLMLLEAGLKPVVSNIAETIVGTTFSIDHFGLYPISALLVKGGVDFIDNAYCANCLQHCLKEKLAKVFRNHQQKPTMFFVNKETEHAWKLKQAEVLFHVDFWRITAMYTEIFWEHTLRNIGEKENTLSNLNTLF